MDRVFGAQGADSKENVAQRPTAPRERPAAEDRRQRITDG
jgi:hypothetical protein